MSTYKSNKVWRESTESEKKIIRGSFPDFLFLDEKEFDRRRKIEEGLFNMISKLHGVIPEEVGLFRESRFILFWEDENPKCILDQDTVDSLGCIVEKVDNETDTANAMAGIPSWHHSVYIEIK